MTRCFLINSQLYLLPSINHYFSQIPSLIPSYVPSALPSVLPSESPSTAPSTTLNYLTVQEFEFILWHPLIDQDMIDQYIIVNAAYSFGELFANESHVLYNLATTFDLEFSNRDGDEPRVNMIGGGKLSHTVFNLLRSLLSYLAHIIPRQK